MGDLIVASLHDDLSDLSLTAARMIAALDDMPVLPPGPPRIAVIVDASASMRERERLPVRKITIEKARNFLQPMFEATSELQVLVLCFGGDDEFGNLGWFADPEAAAQAIASVEHKAGFTQHDRAFKHLLEEIRQTGPIHSAVIFTDAVECRSRGNPNGDVEDELYKGALRLRRHGCRIAVAYKGTIPNGCPFNRAGPGAVKRINVLVADNEGILLNVTDPEFTNKLREVVVEAALRAKGDVDGAQKLLPDLRTVPVDFIARGEKVPVGRCGSVDDDDSN